MTAQIYLIAPADAEAETFPERLGPVLDAAPVAALLLPAGARAADDYEALVRAVLPIAQSRNCAVLVDNIAERVTALGADGVHMTGGIKSVRAAVTDLKPDAIVGAGDIHSHHDAMLKGEAGVDYVLFGDPEGTPDPDARELADWWAETFEIPVVYAPSLEETANLDAGRIDFIALGGAVWDADDPRAALQALAGHLETAQ